MSREKCNGDYQVRSRRSGQRTRFRGHHPVEIVKFFNKASLGKQSVQLMVLHERAECQPSAVQSKPKQTQVPGAIVVCCSQHEHRWNEFELTLTYPDLLNHDSIRGKSNCAKGSRSWHRGGDLAVPERRFIGTNQETISHFKVAFATSLPNINTEAVCIPAVSGGQLPS